MLISASLEKYVESVRELAEEASLNKGGREATAYFEHLIRLQHCLAAIQENGCLVKSVQEGLVDFPHIREGREVYLCWKYGEEDIQYWHEVDAGFAGRTPLSSKD